METEESRDRKYIERQCGCWRNSTNSDGKTPAEGLVCNVSLFVSKRYLQNNNSSSNCEFRDGENCQVHSCGDQRAQQICLSTEQTQYTMCEGKLATYTHGFNQHDSDLT